MTMAAPSRREGVPLVPFLLMRLPRTLRDFSSGVLRHSGGRAARCLPEVGLIISSASPTACLTLGV